MCAVAELEECSMPNKQNFWGRMEAVSDLGMKSLLSLEELMIYFVLLSLFFIGV